MKCPVGIVETMNYNRFMLQIITVGIAHLDKTTGCYAECLSVCHSEMSLYGLVESPTTNTSLDFPVFMVSLS